MKILKAAFVFMTLTSCATISDGPFLQIDGRPMDYDFIGSLEEGKSTLDSTLAQLGAPHAREYKENGMEEIMYTSVKRRESVERSFGKVRSRHYQVLEERVILLFNNGVLIEKTQNHDVY